MSDMPLVPPIKCQGIKTKLVPDIRRIVGKHEFSRWIEPFCGTCVVALNIQPRKALLCDSNKHIITFYKDLQSHRISSGDVRDHLRENGASLVAKGEDYFYEVRERFNANPNSLDFLFLNRSCFNGVMRFNKKGRFNVPFCRKPDRFAVAYITKICNQVSSIGQLISQNDWEFRVCSFEGALADAIEDDFVYADPPYAGRHVDYYNSWSNDDEERLARMLAALPCKFVLSTWHSNEFRSNLAMQRHWGNEQFQVTTKEHFYHVGSTEDLRHPMLEALVTNFAPDRPALPVSPKIQLPLYCETA